MLNEVLLAFPYSKDTIRHHQQQDQVELVKNGRQPTIALKKIFYSPFFFRFLFWHTYFVTKLFTYLILFYMYYFLPIKLT
jgi:hypothetical protein